MFSKVLTALLVVTFSCSGAFAAEKKRASMKRSQISQYEGEYLVDGTKVRKLPSGKNGKTGKQASQSKPTRSAPSKVQARAKPPAQTRSQPPYSRSSPRRMTERSSKSPSRNIASTRKPSRGIASTRSKPSEREVSKNRGRPLSQWKKSGGRSMAGSVKRSPSKPYSKQRVPSSTSKARKPNQTSKKKSSNHYQAPKHAKKSHPVTSHAKKHASQDSGRLPYVRPTNHEQDLPFISIPNTRVRRNDKTIVMGDPDTMPEPVAKVEHVAPTDANLQRTPAAVTDPIARPALVSESGPTAVAAPAPAPGPREPDTFDLHSGGEPTLAR